MAEAGNDPIAERRKERELRTFGAVAGEFLSSHVAVKRKGRTATLISSLGLRTVRRARISRSPGQRSRERQA